MHQIKLFSAFPDTHRIQIMQNDINDWLREARKTFNAMVIHRTDMVYADTLIVFSIYYTFLPNEEKTEDTDKRSAPEKEISPGTDVSGAR